MTYRTVEKQSIHDKKVKEIADNYRGRAWTTKADLSGYEKPDNIYGHIPDVQAILSNKWEEIVEVETRDSIETDKDQHEAFRRYANQRPYTEFKIIMAD